MEKTVKFPKEFSDSEMNYIKQNMKPKMGNVNMEAYTIYSPNEQIVGEWQQMVDGVLKKKPLYQKTINERISNYEDSEGRRTFSGTSVDNIDYAVLQSVFYSRSGSGYTCNSTLITSSATNDIVCNPAFFINTSNNACSIRFQTKLSLAYEYIDCTYTIRYTKTTDTWQTV